MKVVKTFGAYCAGLALALVGFFLLGVPFDLPTWRWIFGIAFLVGAITVWEKWA